jgi:hypothetical protein
MSGVPKRKTATICIDSHWKLRNIWLKFGSIEKKLFDFFFFFEKFALASVGIFPRILQDATHRNSLQHKIVINHSTRKKNSQLILSSSKWNWN